MTSSSCPPVLIGLALIAGGCDGVSDPRVRYVPPLRDSQGCLILYEVRDLDVAKRLDEGGRSFLRIQTNHYFRGSYVERVGTTDVLDCDFTMSEAYLERYRALLARSSVCDAYEVQGTSPNDGGDWISISYGLGHIGAKFISQVFPREAMPNYDEFMQFFHEIRDTARSQPDRDDFARDEWITIIEDGVPKQVMIKVRDYIPGLPDWESTQLTDEVRYGCERRTP